MDQALSLIFVYLNAPLLGAFGFRYITSPSPCSRGLRAITSGSGSPCRGSAASNPSTRPGAPSRASRRCCGCARALALRTAGRCASRTS